MIFIQILFAIIFGFWLPVLGIYFLMRKHDPFQIAVFDLFFLMTRVGQSDIRSKALDSIAKAVATRDLPMLGRIKTRLTQLTQGA